MAGVIIATSLLIAILGFTILQSYIYRRYWNKDLIYSLQSSKNAVFEGEELIITDSLSNGKRLPLPWVHVSYKLSRFLVFLDNISKKVSRGEWRNLIYIVGMNKTISRKSTVLCSKRGYYTATDVSISSNNIFLTGFITEERAISFNLLVYPKIVNYSESIIPLKKMLGDISVKRFIDPDPFTFKGVREYQPYDSFRQINWKATAKIGEIMSNIYDYTVYQDLVVLIDFDNYDDYDRKFVHEEAIRVVAFICRSCINRGIPVSLVCPASDGRPSHLPGGLSNAHLENIYSALAFIDLNIWNHPVSDYIPKEHEKAYILISSSSRRFKIKINAGGDIVTMEVPEDG